MYPHRTFHFLEPFKGKLFNGDIPTLAEIFQIAAARYPDKKCLTTYNPDKFVLTFREARDKILTLAASLVDRGVKPGDRVMHRKFGEGKVVSVEKAGADARITIEFIAYGRKEFSLAIAPIFKIEE